MNPVSVAQVGPARSAFNRRLWTRWCGNRPAWATLHESGVGRPHRSERSVEALFCYPEKEFSEVHALKGIAGATEGVFSTQAYPHVFDGIADALVAVEFVEPEHCKGMEACSGSRMTPSQLYVAVYFGCGEVSLLSLGVPSQPAPLGPLLPSEIGKVHEPRQEQTSGPNPDRVHHDLLCQARGPKVDERRKR